MSSQNVLVTILLNHIKAIHKKYKNEKFFYVWGQYNLIECLAQELDKLAAEDLKYEEAARLCHDFPNNYICEMCLARFLTNNFDDDFIWEFSELFLTSTVCRCIRESAPVCSCCPDSDDSEDDQLPRCVTLPDIPLCVGKVRGEGVEYH
jgi:hypothetical protein